MTSSEREGRPGEPPGPARKWVLILTAVIGLGTVAVLVFALQRGRLNSKASPANPPAEDGQAPEASRTVGVAPDHVPIDSSPNRVSPRPPAFTGGTPAQPGASAHARQLVKSLTEVSLQQGELTPEQAETWQRNLGELLQLGVEAVPALQEFFQRHEDVRFDSGPGTNLLGEPTLRIAFLKLLSDLPGPENLELQEQVLRASADPDEIALLARQLEMQEPDKYRQAIIEAATAALERAQKAKLPGRDISPLVDILKQYEDPGAK